MRVFSNLAISVDGKIADLSCPAKAFGTSYDRVMMQKIRNQADVVIVGAKTLATMKKAAKKTLKKKKSVSLVNAVVTASGNLTQSKQFWNDASVIRYVFTTEKGYRRALETSRDRAFVVVAGKSQVDIHKVLRVFQQCGLKNILVEGGGSLMASFIEAECLDELYVTLTPWIIGGVANPTLVDGIGLKNWARLKLKNSKRVGNELYIHYHVVGKRRKNG